MGHRIYFMEGIPGSGKTTRAAALRRELAGRGREPVCFHECEANPLDLARHALLTAEEYRQLREKVWDKAGGDAAEAGYILDMLDRVSEARDGRVYVAFQCLYRDERTESVAYGLRKRDVYNGHVPFEVFRRLHLERWERFARGAAAGEDVYICDAILLQSPLFELMGYYDLPERDIAAYIGELAGHVQALDPLVCYNRVTDVPGLMAATCAARRDDPDKWERGFYKWMEVTPYFQRRDLHGFEGMCAFLDRRQRLELRLLEKLGLPCAFLDRQL